MKKIITVLLLITLISFTACQEIETQLEENISPSIEINQTEPTQMVEENQTQQNQTEEESCPTCSLTLVTLTTSDNNQHELQPNKGGYVAAGGLLWKVLPTEFCQDNPLVDIQITKQSYGEILSQEVIQLEEGQTSQVLTHPNIPDLEFTLTIDEIEFNCQ